MSYFEIEMGDVVTVEVLHAQQDLLDEVGGLLLGQPLPLSDEVEQLTAPQTIKSIVQ